MPVASPTVCLASSSSADWPPSYSYRGRIGFTCVTARVFASPVARTPLLEPPLVWLHAEQAIYMVNSFQFTKSARLILVTDREEAGKKSLVRPLVHWSRKWVGRARRLWPNC